MKVLLTGANGYIGRRLLPVLVGQGHEVICLVRDQRRMELEESLQNKVHFFEADLLYKDQLEDLPKDLDVAYYLVHSMGASYEDFSSMEQQAAENFVQSLARTNARQIVYLGGISNDANLSSHLKSRLKVEEILGQSHIPLTVLRAAIIIGSGSASFEIIRDLVEKLPVMVAPRWLQTRCQPIAIRNVIEYLSHILLDERTFHETFDIGGPDILTYREMLLQFAEFRGLKRSIINVPVLSPRLSSYWLYFITSTSFSLARNLVDSMRNEVVMQNNKIHAILPLDLIPYREAVAKAFDKIAQNEVVSSWKDALLDSQVNGRLHDFVKVPTYGCFIDQRKKKLTKPAALVLKTIWRIGGQRGWYYANGLWKLRGFLDLLVGGVGLRRGRRSPTTLLTGDSLDFWRVLMADSEKGRLLLYAEMKLPGEAWLEFCIKGPPGEQTLIQTATFRPEGVWGRLYWYAVLPFHYFLFEGMIQRILNYQEEQEEEAITDSTVLLQKGERSPDRKSLP